jgi:peptidoglycan/xylan/chitin deacetylase (PgdA/CDA1 family)
MEQLAEQNGYDRSEMQSKPLLSWEEVRALSEHPLVTIGAHTQSHTLLSRQPWRVALEEMRTAKQRLEEQIGRSVSAISYPYGGSNMIIRQMARWLGFDYGFTTEACRVNHVTAWNRLALPRIDISELVPDDE